jgi:cytochrome c oxidase cbb3-type subunit III
MTDNPNDKRDVVLDHNYDGIQELDNPLPMWWLWTFFGTIIFAFIYWIHYELGAGPSTNTALMNQLEQIEQLRKLEDRKAPQKSATDLSALVNNPEFISKGSKMFQMNCANCHGVSGQGGIGPNLTDKYWLHGEGDITSVINIIRGGVLDKGMPAWEALFKAEEIEALGAFVMSIKNSNPPNAKALQGDEKGS